MISGNEHNMFTGIFSIIPSKKTTVQYFCTFTYKISIFPILFATLPRVNKFKMCKTGF